MMKIKQMMKTWPIFKILIGLPAMILLSAHSMATVVLPSLVSDNMVMQQSVPVHIWGKASIGEKVSIAILQQKITVVADDKGDWETWLKPMKAANAPVNMMVSGTNSIIIHNILIGEVWLASGQSNMEWNVSQSDNADEEIKNANYPMMRLFVPTKSISDSIKTDIPGKWVLCTPETIPKFTAVGYFFGRGLHQKLGIPVGLIEAAWGATNCQSWTPINAIQADPRLNYLEEDWKKYVASLPQRQKEYEAAHSKWQELSAQQKAEGKPIAEEPRAAQMSLKDKPAVIYNAVIAPISHYTIKGVVWYQGEANAYERVSYPYRYLFPTMIQAWRKAWKQGDFPFLFVQLSMLGKHPYWPMLRESQTETLNLKNTAMAVSIDVGDSTNAHYKNKQAIGYRLELAARSLAYGENIEYSGPTLRQATVEGNQVRIWLDHAKGLKTTNGEAITGFVIAGADGKLLPATATIDGETILLTNPAISKPTNARYAFKDVPLVNLVNASGLPAVPFRTDVHDGL